MPVELSPHQAQAVKDLSNGKILKGGVGSGKSRTAAVYAYCRVMAGELKINGVGEDTSPERPRDVYVITTAKKRDSLEWLGEFAPLRIGADRESSISGIQLTIDSWNNVAKYVNVENAFFIFDEQRLVGSGAWVKAFLKIVKSNQWLVLSATPGDVWMDYAPVFIANGWYKNKTDFVRTHVVFGRYGNFPKIERYIETDRLENLRRRVLVEMPHTRHTFPHNETIFIDYDKELFDLVWKERWNVYTQEPLLDVAEMFRVGRKVVNSDPARLGEVLKVTEKHPRLIIFYNFDYELELLRTLSSVLDIEIAEWNGHKHQDVPAGDRWLYLVQYTAGAEGWNCITTNATFFFSMNYSWKIMEQAKGRTDRMNTPYLDQYYYTLRTTAKIDQLIAKALAKKGNFNERKFAKTWEPRPEGSPAPQAAISSRGTETGQAVRDAATDLSSIDSRVHPGGGISGNSIWHEREPKPDPGFFDSSGSGGNGLAAKYAHIPEGVLE